MDKKQNRFITIISIIIPIVVALLFKVKVDVELPVFLPPIYATINGLTAILLIVALVAIKQKNINLHKNIIKICIGLSVLFLLLYVVHHATHESTVFGGTGTIKTVYLTILLTHIVLSIVVIPFVLFTLARALNNNFEAHKKLARIAFPIWLYVAVTGVIVYVMIAPYY